MLTKIAVLVSGGGTNLQALLDAEKSGIIKSGKITLVLSNNANAYALERAKNSGVKTAVVLRKDYDSRASFDDAMLKVLKENEIDMIVLAGFMSILTEKFTKAFENRIINVHPALIPSFCGPGYYGIHVHEEVYKRGVKVSGATVHFVSKVVDGGPIILQQAIDITDCKSPEEIQEKILNNIEHNLLVKAVQLYCDHKLKVENERVEII